MQSFDTDNNDEARVARGNRHLQICASEELSAGSCSRFQLPNGDEVAVFNIDGEYYAIDNFCPHRGAPLSDGVVCGYVVECEWHGWQFDVRTGNCLTVTDRIKTYEVREEAGQIKITIPDG